MVQFLISLVAVLLCFSLSSYGFVTPSVSLPPFRVSRFSLYDKGPENEDIVRSGGATAAGAVLGGLLLGPFGALFGAQLGASAGQRANLDAAVTRELRSKGLTKDMLRAAEEVALDLKRAEEAEGLVRDALRSFQELARRLDGEQTSLTDKAKVMLTMGDDEGAKDALLRRERAKENLVNALKGAAGEMERLKKMEDNVAAMQIRAVEVENSIKKIAAESLVDGLDGEVGGLGGLKLEQSDPLLDKFKALEEKMKGGKDKE